MDLRRLIIVPLMLLATSAFATDIKISDMIEDTSPSSTDVLLEVKNPGTTPMTRKVTIGNVVNTRDLSGYALTSNTVANSKLGAANGVATLGADSKVTSSQLPASLVGAVLYKGVLDASGGSYPGSPTKGDYYVISVSGTISATAYYVGDWAAYNGSSWDKIDNSASSSGWSTVAGIVKLLDASKNVGIGSAIPTQKLDVNGTVKATAFSGPLTGAVTGNVTGNLTGNVTGNVTGNASTATSATSATSATTATTATSATSATTAGTVTTAAQPAITSVGTLTGLTVTNPIVGSVTGNSGTATALASTPSTCASNQAAIGINANGSAQGCWTPSSGGSSQWTGTSPIYVTGINVGIGTTVPVSALEVRGKLTSANINTDIYIDGAVYAQNYTGLTSALSGATSGQTIKMPCGTYAITSKLLMNKANVNLVGSGKCTILSLANSVNDSVIQVTADDVRLSNFQINANGPGQTTVADWCGAASNAYYSAIDIETTNRTKIDNVYLQNAAATGIYVNNSTDTSIVDSTIYNVGTHHPVCYFGFGVAGNTTNNLTVKNTRIDYIWKSGIMLAFNPTNDYFNFQNNKISRVFRDSHSGIEVDTGAYGNISGNNIFNCPLTAAGGNTNGVNGILISSPGTVISGNTISNVSGVCIETGNQSGGTSATDASVTGNTCSASATAGTDATGIYVGVSRAVVSGNKISPFGRIGIQVGAGATDLIIANNLMMNNVKNDANYGIYFNSGGSRIKIINNAVVSSSSPQIISWGVYLDGTAVTALDMHGNYFYGMGSGSISGTTPTYVAMTTIATGTNVKCDTTCGTSRCLYGIDNTNKVPLACTDATADTCVCMGP